MSKQNVHTQRRYPRELRERAVRMVGRRSPRTAASATA